MPLVSAPVQVGAKGHSFSRSRARRFATGAREFFGSTFPFGRADVGADDDPRSLIQKIVDGGQGRPDAGVVDDVSLVIERHVEIDAQENPLARDVDVLDAEFRVTVFNVARDCPHYT